MPGSEERDDERGGGTEHGEAPASGVTSPEKPALDAPRRAAAPPRDGWRRRLAIALGIYALCAIGFCWVAGARLQTHTINNHFAVQAEVWRQGRWYLTEDDIAGRARRGELDMNNDWAIVRHVDPATQRVEVRYFNSFPVFPAVLMYPFVAAAGGAILFNDTLFVVLLAGVGPMLLFLALETLRIQARSARSQAEHAGLALLFAFGTVYFFSAVQGTVWFAAHVVAVALTGGYLLASFRADRRWACALAGLIVACGLHTRPSFQLCVLLFAFEAARASLRAPVRTDGAWTLRAGDAWKKLDLRALLVRYAWFSLPILIAIAVLFRINQARFGSPWEFGHTLLNVVWMERVKRYGLFSFHYLSRNLTCAFTLLPVVNPATAPATVARWQVSGNGLALWFTTPLYLWLLWPRRTIALHWALWATAAPIALMDLLYQNSGWIQFGYRFSNDYAQYLFVLLAIGARPFGALFRTAAIWSVAINTFGAITFQRAGYEKYYFLQTYSVPLYDGSSGVQSSTYPPD
ncbi:MAG: hypothetical protein NVS3B10_14430 [Polyangiales bacterium]